MVQPGFFVLHPAVLPPVPAGPYTLHGEVEDMPSGPVAPLDTHISVSSPRYTMPPDQILSTFPPANGEGAYRATLPQIVLKRRTLPWERKVDPDERIPWLALVVIAEGEGSLSSESPIEQCISDFSKVPQPGDRDVATSVYLSVTQTVVNGVFPCKEDLELLAHVREVDLSDSELASGDDDGFLAVVVANRLPQPGFDEATGPTPKKYLACLINLETQLAVLPPPTPDNALVHEFDALAVVQDLRPAAQALLDDPDHFAMGTVTSFTPGGRQSAGSGIAADSARGAGAIAYVGAADSVDPVSRAVHTGSSWSPSPAAIEKAAVSYAATDAARIVRDAMAGGWRLPIEAIVLEPTYRFPVLAHWSFTVTGDATFEQYMQHLDVGLLGTMEGDTPPLTPEEKARQAKSADTAAGCAPRPGARRDRPRRPRPPDPARRPRAGVVPRPGLAPPDQARDGADDRRAEGTAAVRSHQRSAPPRRARRSRGRVLRLRLRDRPTPRTLAASGRECAPSLAAGAVRCATRGHAGSARGGSVHLLR